MRLETFRVGLFAGCTAALASLGISAPARAVAAAPTAYIIEGPGIYTLINNSSFQVYRFIVSNPGANSHSSAFTTQTGWTATVCSGGCPDAIQNGFLYIDSGVSADLGSGQSSGKFYFGAGPASTYEIYLRDATDQNHIIVTGAAVAGVPEPATWALMLVGLGAAGTVVRRRRAGESVALSA